MFPFKKFLEAWRTRRKGPPDRLKLEDLPPDDPERLEVLTNYLIAVREHARACELLNFFWFGALCDGVFVCLLTLAVRSV